MNRNARGLTVIEILMVVGVLGVIMAIGVPTYRGFQARARGAACAKNLRDIGVGLTAYLSEHEMKMPTMVTARADKSEEQRALDTVLAEYVSGDLSFQCPGDHGGIYEQTGTSYFWNNLLNGQSAYKLQFFFKEGDSGIPLAGDKEKFHPGIGDEINILYADGHVAKDLRFFVTE